MQQILRRKRHGTLCDIQRKLWRGFKAKRAAGKVVALNACALSPPSVKDQAQNILKYERRRARQASKSKSVQNVGAWTNAEVKGTMRDLGIITADGTTWGNVRADDLVCLSSRESVANNKNHYAIAGPLVGSLCFMFTLHEG